MGFSGYFLIVSDFIKWSKQNNIAVGPGRGSGAGSIIAWTMQITDLDPIKFGLLFGKAGFIILFSCDWTLSAILKHFVQLLGLEQTITILGLLLFNIPI